jgi:hypothetical protein
VLGAGGRLLHLVEGLLVPHLGVAGDQRALLDHVVDALEHAVGGGLALGHPVQRLDLLDQAGAGRLQDRELAGHGRGVPAQGVAEQHRGLVVQVVAGADDVVAAVQGGPVEHVALGQPAHPAGGAAAGAGRLGMV